MVGKEKGPEAAIDIIEMGTVQRSGQRQNKSFILQNPVGTRFNHEAGRGRNI